MKKIVITLIALFSVLVFSQPIRADTEQIATMNLAGSWGTTQVLITRSNGKLHIKHTGTIRFFGPGSIRSVQGNIDLYVKKNNDSDYIASRLNFSMVNESKENDIDIDQGENDTFTFILKVGVQSIGMDPMGMPYLPATINDQSTTPTVVSPPKKPQASPITINYVDEDGRIIHDSQQITGNYGDNYDATISSYKLDLKGYTLDQSKLPNNATGKISSTEQTVTYVYKASWGNVPWEFDESTGTVTFTGSGTLGEYTTSPWNREDDFHINWSAIKKIVFTNVVNAPESSKYLFSSYEKSARLKNLLSIEGLDKVNTSNVKSMFWMFTDASALTELKGIEHWDTKNVTDMNNMFGGMLNLLSLDISNFSTEKVTSMSIMFNLATKLERLTLGKNSILNSSVNLPYISNNRDYTGNWVLEGSEKTVNMGNSTQFTNTYDGSKPGTYMWEKKVKQLTFKKVPDTMSFEDSKIFNNTIESKRKDRDWKMIVEDTRVDKNPWRVTAKLVEPFKNSSGESAAGNILLFRKTNASDQWITESEETNVFDGTSTKGIDDYDVSWSQDSGPIIQVAPGTVKAGEYKGVIQWSLTDAPV